MAQYELVRWVCRCTCVVLRKETESGVLCVLRFWSSCWPCAASQVCARCSATWSSDPPDPDLEPQAVGKAQDRTGGWFWCSGSARPWRAPKRARSEPCSCCRSCWRCDFIIQISAHVLEVNVYILVILSLKKRAGNKKQMSRGQKL